MADLPGHLVKQLEGTKRMRGVPYVVLEEVVRATVAELELGELLRQRAYTSVWCDACGKEMSHHDVKSGPADEEWCSDCAAQFGRDEEE